MRVSDIARSIAFGFLFSIFAIAILPFLVSYSLIEMYGSPELYEWMGIPPLCIIPRLKKTEKKDTEDEA